MDRTFQAMSAQNAFPNSEGSCGDLSEMEAQLLDGGPIGALLFRGQRRLGATTLLHSLEQVPRGIWQEASVRAHLGSLLRRWVFPGMGAKSTADAWGVQKPAPPHL